MERRLGITVLIIALGLVAAGPAAAQSNGPNVAFGYSFVRLLDDADYNVPVGWVVSVGAPIKGSLLSVVGEFAGNYNREEGETLWLYTVQGGVRLSRPANASGVMPFGQILAGVMAVGCCGESDSAFALEPGGGVDVAVGRRLAVRVGASVPLVFSDGDTGHSLRLQAGIVLGPLRR